MPAGSTGPDPSASAGWVKRTPRRPARVAGHASAVYMRQNSGFICLDAFIAMPSFRPAPLTGIRVLDLTRVLAGPWCTQNLADLGAEVIKIERPGSGDDTRGWGPPYVQDAQGQDTTEAAYYASANRNKYSVAVDISSQKGADLVRELAKQCDILVENFKVGGLRKYGLDYESIKAVNPRLIYCSITGFGQTGPYAS